MGDSRPVRLEIQFVGSERQAFVGPVDHVSSVFQRSQLGHRTDNDLRADSQRVAHRDSDGGEVVMISFSYHGFILVAFTIEGLILFHLRSGLVSFLFEQKNKGACRSKRPCEGVV